MTDGTIDPPEDVLAPVDNWAGALRRRLAGAPPRVAELVAHLASLEDARPRRTWKRRTLALLREPDARAVVADGVRLLARCGPGRVPVYSASWDDRGLIGHPNLGVARGFLWAATSAGDTAVLADLLTVGRRAGGNLPEFSPCDRLTESLIHAPAEWADPAALETLWTLHRDLIPGRPHRRLYARVLPKAADRLGIPPERQAERTVPALGLRADGSVAFGGRLGRGAHWHLPTFSALVTVEDAHTVSLVYADAEVEQRTVHPFAAPHGFEKRHHAETVDWMRRYAKNVLDTVRGERERLRGLAEEDRDRTFEEWAHLYRDHPITGVVARGLVWEFRDARGEVDRRPSDRARRGTDDRRRPDAPRPRRQGPGPAVARGPGAGRRGGRLAGARRPSRCAALVRPGRRSAVSGPCVIRSPRSLRSRWARPRWVRPG
ncbi:DUF4132 domain-containing protein [Streptomyces macrosporus]|uniref:DUF4132 domain-containing protein n=1 Tax=Streptomyces macrosporus TaxID=44032 RepID=A0ABN3KAG9_9ACTN